MRNFGLILLFGGVALWARSAPLVPGHAGARSTPRWVVGEIDRVAKPRRLSRAPKVQSAGIGAKAPQAASAPAEASASGPVSDSAIVIRPRYPRRSRLLGEEGEVRVRAVVSSAGVAASVLRSSGFERLDEAALEAVRAARFDGFVGDRELRVVFRLD